MSNLHVPITALTEFSELEPASGIDSAAALLDDGTLYGGGLNAIDHHQREIRYAVSYETHPASPEQMPARADAALFPWSPERRAVQPPLVYDVHTGQYVTSWVYQPGGAAAEVTIFLGEQSHLITYDKVQPYDGASFNEAVSDRVADNGYWDFQYELTYPVHNPDGSDTIGTLRALEYRTFRAPGLSVGRNPD